MSEALTIVAEELCRALALIWGGIGIAIKLNYQIMSFLMRCSTKIIHLLLLLIRKVSDVFTLILHDTSLFLGDIGSGLLAFCYTSQAIVSGIINAFYKGGIYISTSFNYLWTQCSNFYSYITELISNCIEYLQYIMDLIKSGFILFGSSILFTITLIPNLIYLLYKGLIYYIFNTSSLIRDLFSYYNKKLKFFMLNTFTSIIYYFKDIPISAIVGAVIGFLILRFMIKYLKNNVNFRPILLHTLSFFVNLWRKLTDYSLCLKNKIVYLYVNYRPIRNTIVENINHENIDYNDQLNGLNILNQPEQNNYANGATSSSNNSLFRPNLIRRPLTRRQRALGLAFNEELLENGTKNSKSDKHHTNSNTEWAKQLYRELEEERETQLCVICQDKPKQVILLPCRHLCLCDACRSAVITRDNNCPMCRRPIMDTMRVYL